MATPRGGRSSLSVGDASAHPYGRTTDTLLRLMDAPTSPSAYYPEHLLAALLLLDLPQWATETGHEIGTRCVRSLALALAKLKVGLDPGSVNNSGVFAVAPESAAAFLRIVDPDVAALLVDAVGAADHPRDSHVDRYSSGEWADAAVLWAAEAANSQDDWWMDAGMFARETFVSVSNGGTAEDLLATVAVVFGGADADLLRAGLGAFGLLGWPAYDLATPELIEGDQ